MNNLFLSLFITEKEQDKRILGALTSDHECFRGELRPWLGLAGCRHGEIKLHAGRTPPQRVEAT